MAYWILRCVTGLLLRWIFRITVVGLKNVPRRGGVIVAMNHRAIVDSFLMPMLLRRRFTFLAKSEYYNGKGFVGWLKRTFFSIVAHPVDRNDRLAGQKSIEIMKAIVDSGRMVGIHPEGTRVPGNDAVYKGKASVIEVAWKTGAAVVPVAVIGTEVANPKQPREIHIPRWVPRAIVRLFSWLRYVRPGATIVVVIGEPMYFHEAHLFKGHARSTQVRRLMERIAELADAEYIHLDAEEAKLRTHAA